MRLHRLVLSGVVVAFWAFLSGCPALIPNVIFVSPAESTIQVGRNLTLTAVGTSISERYRWQSEMPGIATVNEKGIVTGISPGMAAILATGETSGDVGLAVVIVVGAAEVFDTIEVVGLTATSPSLGVPAVVAELDTGERFLLDDLDYISAYRERAPDLSTKARDLDAFVGDVVRMKQRPAQDRISLAAFQTPIKNQQDRGTCVPHTIVAALEAAYNRLGVGPLDLSEQHVMHLLKTTWLHDFTRNDGDVQTRDGWENQLGLSGGGDVYYALDILTKYRVPREALHSYRHTNSPGYGFGDYSSTNQVGDMPGADWRDRTGAVDQAMISDFNMGQSLKTIQVPGNFDMTPLPQQGLEDAKYGVASFIRVPTNQVHDAVWYEQQLAAGREILLGLNFLTRTEDGILYPRDRNGTESLAGHAVLIVGYDRSDADAPFFLVKNSWGESGFIRLSYDFLSTDFDGRIVQAACITGVRPIDDEAIPPQLYMGRWKVLIDGTPGTLDIHRNSGFYAANSIGGVEDYRLGAFYDQSGALYRVNGRIDDAGRLEAYIDFDHPALDYGARTGSRFVAHLDLADARLISGTYGPVGGATEGAFYATKGQFFNPVSAQATTSAERFLGRWRIESPVFEGQLEIRSVQNNTFSGRYNRPTGGWVSLGGTADPASGLVDFILPTVPGGRFEGFIHSSSPGIISGTLSEGSDAASFVLVRIGSATETIRITAPQNGNTFNQGDTIQLRSVVEVDGLPLPSALVIWTENGPYDPANPSAHRILSQSGLNGSTKLGAGAYEIFATYIGETMVSESVSIVVSGPGDPVVTIISPAADAVIQDAATSPPDVPVSFSATAFAANGAGLSGSALVWSYRRVGDATWFDAGVTGRNVVIALRDDNCASTPYDVRVQATDGSGRVGTAIVRVGVIGFFCR